MGKLGEVGGNEENWELEQSGRNSGRTVNLYEPRIQDTIDLSAAT